MKNLSLPHGASMPLLGFGVYQIPADETQAAVEAALQAGYRHIDTAAAYGNEEAVGAALRAVGLPRGDVFVTTKLWIQRAPAQANAERALTRSLERLGLESVDLFLMHQPMGDVYGQWRAMEALQAQGGATEIGVSNFPVDRVVDLALHNEVAPAVNQIEVNPFHQRREKVAALQAEGVAVQAWAPFAEGRNGIFEHPVLVRIAAEHGASVAQVILAWVVSRDVVALAKSVRPERIAENLAAAELTLTPEDLAAIEALDAGESQFFDHADPKMVRWLGGRAEDPQG